MERTDKVVREADQAGALGRGHRPHRGLRRLRRRHASPTRPMPARSSSPSSRSRSGSPTGITHRRHPERPAPDAGPDAGGVRPGDQPAARARHRHRRRLQAVCRGPPRPRPAGAGGGDQRAGRPRQPGARPDLGVHAVQHPHAQGLCRHRPGQGRDAGRAGRATCSTRSTSIWARPTSTTSTISAAPTACRPRPTASSGARCATSPT